MELTTCYVINKKKLISAERYIVGFNVIIFKKNYGCFKMASFKNV